jgi:hypothetical protein
MRRSIQRGLLRHAGTGLWVEPVLDVFALFLAVDLVALALVDLEFLDGVALLFHHLLEGGFGHPLLFGHIARRFSHGQTGNSEKSGGNNNFLHDTSLINKTQQVLVDVFQPCNLKATLSASVKNVSRLEPLQQAVRALADLSPKPGTGR